MFNNTNLVDSYGRRVTYLRVSLTDRCNFRCLYCVPPQGIPLLDSARHLTLEEIVRFVRIAAHLGISRVRLTGGEPLLRQDILAIVRALKKIPKIRDLSITTNGSRLPLMVYPLKEAGLDRLNVSLDSLSPVRFKKITASDTFSEVFNGIKLALEVGFPVKLNMVVLKDTMPNDMIEFVKLAEVYPLEVRFLEFMPLCGSNWKDDLFIPIREIRDLMKKHFALLPVPNRFEHVAETYVLEKGRGRVGFIGSLTESFCGHCSRIRLTADGQIFPCLFSNVHVPVGKLLKSGAADDLIAEAVREAVRAKPAGNLYHEKPFGVAEENRTEFMDTPSIRRLGG